MSKNLVVEIVENIKECANDLKNESVLNDVDYGTLIGYCEALTIIKGAYAGYDINELGLDFDIDNEYLI